MSENQNTIELELTQSEFGQLLQDLMGWGFYCRNEDFDSDAKEAKELFDKLYEQGYPQLD